MALGIYKKGQGKYTRLWTGFIGMIVVGIGCYQLYKKLAGADFNLWVETMIPAGLCLVLCGLIYGLLNRPSVADFMIVSEGEMKKVSWSSRREITTSTLIVVVVVVLMALLLGFTDLGFQLFFRWLLKTS
jgi:preprotein translocase subunit SecE